MKDKWKVIAIIFICLFILESIFLIWIFAAGTEAIDNENECAYNICDAPNTYDAYAYDEYYKICYCYVDGEIEHQKYMG